MKKFIFMLIFLFSVQFVSAEISVLSQIEDIYNINEKIPLKLTINYDQELDGFVKSSLICDNANLDYFITPFTFKASPQELIIPDLRLTKNMLGKCSLEVSLTDSGDVLLEKKSVKIFEVSENLILTVNLDKEKFYPNDELQIKGDVKNVRGELLDAGKADIILDNEKLNADLDKGEFSYNYQIPGNIKSNSHELKISFEDDYGNKADKEFSIFINPKPTQLKNLFNKIDFLPNDRVTIESLLYDQAADLMENNAEIRVFNPDEDLIKEGNYKLEFTLDQYALPGEWTVKTSTADFSIESKFKVGEVKKVQTYVEDGALYVKNIGNVEFDDVIEIKAIGLDGKEFEEKIKLSPKESKIIDLSDELKKGRYDLNVLADSQKESFESVNVPESDNPLYLTTKAVTETGNKLIDKPYILIAIILCAVSLVYFIQTAKKRNQFRKEREVQLGYNKAREIAQEKIKQGIKPKKFNIDESEAKDFRERMLKNMNEKKNDDQGYLHKNPKNDKPGLFGMFN